VKVTELPNGLIEDEAALAIKEGLSVEAGLSLSSAISLKRLADAVWGVDDTSGLLQLLNPLHMTNHY
jgi:hypothetical protein